MLTLWPVPDPGRRYALLKPRHLLTLRAVVRTSSFVIAARELGYTASAISQQVSALEKETGLVLFEREAHGPGPSTPPSSRTRWRCCTTPAGNGHRCARG
ncbi:helix-turn-helix domain-containing protein [Streptomyces rhizosphaericus]|uniref:helix-turn-helix domain-containing protein n=1 Tax=Streptomyces rhizosphaericus TaxID=114699 RepID=UPI0035D44FDA